MTPLDLNMITALAEGVARRWPGLDPRELWTPGYLALVRVRERLKPGAGPCCGYVRTRVRGAMRDYVRALRGKRTRAAKAGVAEPVSLDVILDPPSDAVAPDQGARVAEALSRLGPPGTRLRRVVEARVYGGATLAEIGAELGVTRERVRQLLEEAREVLVG